MKTQMTIGGINANEIRQRPILKLLSNAADGKKTKLSDENNVAITLRPTTNQPIEPPA